MTVEQARQLLAAHLRAEGRGAGQGETGSFEYPGRSGVGDGDVGIEPGEPALTIGPRHQVRQCSPRQAPAARGGGAWCGERRLQVSAVPTLSEALLVTGFAYDRRERAAFYARMIEAFLQRGQCIRRGGAASLDFCLLAEGRDGQAG